MIRDFCSTLQDEEERFTKCISHSNNDVGQELCEPINQSIIVQYKCVL